jgi:hypothetical protein
MNKNSLKYLIFVVVIFCFIAIPAIILSYSVYRYYQTNEEQIIYDLKSDMQRMASELRRNVIGEKYFCRLFHDYWISVVKNPDSNVNNLLVFCKQIKKYYEDDIDFVVIDDKGKVFLNTKPEFYKHTIEEWKDAFYYAKSFNSFLPDNPHINMFYDVNALRKIIGSQVVKNSLDNIYEQAIYSFIWGDSSGRIPPSSIYTFNFGGFFVFASKKLLRGDKHLRYNAIDYSAGKKIITGLYNVNSISNSFCSSKTIKNVEDIKRMLISPEYKNKDFIDAEYYYVCQQYLTKDNYIFVMKEKNNTKTDLIIKAVLVFVFYFLLSFPIVKYFWNTIILKIPGNASIRLKLGFLFLFATGIPLLSLAVVSHEYELHRRMALIEEARAWSVENLLGIEQRYQAYLKKICNEFDDYVDKWSIKLKERELNFEYSRVLWNKFASRGAFDFYCIGSDTSYIATPEGFFRYSGSLDSIKFDMAKSVICSEVKNYRYDEFKLANIIIKKLCSDLNGKEIPSSILSKLELIAENIMQKSFPEIIYNIIEVIGEIKEWGFGNKSNMTYFKFISLNDKSITDFGVLASWRPRDIQDMFVNDIIPKANRNDKNFKFISYERIERFFIPSLYREYNEVEKIARRATDKPTEELEFINLDGEDYIAVSFMGRFLNRYNFVGLYPVRNIDNLIYKQSSLFWLLGISCLILSIGLAHLLSKSFINPLNTLQGGALAIENRNFKHRLSGLNVDEFGEVGGIFNHVMVGLEELEVAKIVQESMFPKPGFNQGNFSVYGKSVTMIDVGGDYLDFFKVDDNSFSVLVGDVAGHGVGAAVIMAMAKAAILGGGDSLKSPAAMLNQLHKMILATKTSKQKKIMTFQYMYINSETGENLYGNAGACSPFLIRHSENKVEEMKMSGAALGAFKRAVYKEMPLDFRPGDAIVFYTDGIVECKNINGEMLGYDRLKTTLLQCWDSNPETYYNNILKAYNDYVGEDAEAGDDLTFVILIYNEKKELNEEETENKPVIDIS